MSKNVTCKRCGQKNLEWAQTKAGKWYLTPIEGKKIYGENGRHIKTLALAHKCPSAEDLRNEERDLLYIVKLEEFKGRYNAHDLAVQAVYAELGEWE